MEERTKQLEHFEELEINDLLLTYRLFGKNGNDPTYFKKVYQPFFWYFDYEMRIKQKKMIFDVIINQDDLNDFYQNGKSFLEHYHTY